MSKPLQFCLPAAQGQALPVSRVERSVSFRVANLADFPYLLNLTRTHLNAFADETYRAGLDTLPQELATMIAQGQVVVLFTRGAQQQEVLIGTIGFEPIVPGETAEIHALFEPKYLKTLLKTEVLPQVLHWAFQQWQLQTLTAECHPWQKQATRLLTRYGFTLV